MGASFVHTTVASLAISRRSGDPAGVGERSAREMVDPGRSGSGSTTEAPSRLTSAVIPLEYCQTLWLLAREYLRTIGTVQDRRNVRRSWRFIFGPPQSCQASSLLRPFQGP